MHTYFAVVWLGLAQAQSEAPSPTPPPANVTPEELELLQRSLGADALTAPAPAEDAPLSVGGSAPPAARPTQSMNPDLALVLDVAGAWFSELEPLQGGEHDPTSRGFNLQQLEATFGANVDPFFRFDASLVFSLEGVELEEAYATSLALPGNLQARAGQFLTRFGRSNTQHPHAWSFVDQPLVLAKLFGPDGSRGVGAELAWLAPLPWFVELVGAATGAASECCARSFLGEATPRVHALDDLLYTLELEQFFPLDPAWSVLFGISAQLGPNPEGRTAIYGADLYVRYKPVDSPSRAALSLTVEALARERRLAGRVLRDHGGYAQLAWRFAREWETGARYELVSGVEDDPLDPEWTSARQRTSAQLSYFPSHFARLRLQGSVDQPPRAWRDEPIWAAVLALEIIAGAHGAHTF